MLSTDKKKDLGKKSEQIHSKSDEKFCDYPGIHLFRDKTNAVCSDFETV